MFNNQPMKARVQKVYACEGTDCGSSCEHERIAQQTGQLLTTLGHMFVNLPAFNQHINHGTGELLISLGNKLSARQ